MAGDDMKIIADRWMMESRQIVNWGSYDGYQEFRPSIDAESPVTLLAGASESGKSTLVDAQISLLYPNGTPYNKASNAGRSERNDYTYLRHRRHIREPHHRKYALLRQIPLPARRRRQRRGAPSLHCMESQNRSANHGPVP